MRGLIRRKIESQESDREELEADLIRRAMVLRKAERIGILWAERGRFFISMSKFDPWGTRRLLALNELKTLVEEAEGAPKKPVQSEGGRTGGRILHVAE